MQIRWLNLLISLAGDSGISEYGRESGLQRQVTWPRLIKIQLPAYFKRNELHRSCSLGTNYDEANSPYNVLILVRMAC